MRPILSVLTIFLLMLACSSSESTLDTNSSTNNVEENQNEETGFETLNPEISEHEAYQYQSSLSDTYIYRTNEIPEAYARLKVEKEEEEDEKDLYEGYRVQIYSGQDVALADTVAMQFRAWSDTTIVGYQADTYTSFKSPYYRVHVGDFHDRNKAIYFSNLLKRRFRDSWVVYDRVNPWNVPSDTTYIYID